MAATQPLDSRILSQLIPREYDGKSAQEGRRFLAHTCYDWVSSEEGKTSETGRSAELAFVQRDWS